MAFTLSVQFTGLCLHVINPDRPNEAAVLLPDARFRNKVQSHVDGTPAVPHVGYLRVDLANVALSNAAARFPRGELPAEDPDDDDGPFLEIIYRFRRQTMDFGLPPNDDPIDAAPGVPDLTHIAPPLQLLPDLFKGSVASPLLLRTLVQGGTLKPTADTSFFETWSVDGRLNTASPTAIIKKFSGDVTWIRPVDGDDLTITLTNFDGSNPLILPLKPVDTPVGKVIMLKVANLCADNPLEWNDFQLRMPDSEDSDFKWCYKLTQPPGKWEELLGDFVLPAPRVMSRPGSLRGGGIRDCFGAQMTSAFPARAEWTNP